MGEYGDDAFHETGTHVRTGHLHLSDDAEALEPKRLVLIRGGHFDPYLSGFQISCGAAVDWFRQHLGR
jgi:hypothetical protein